MARPELGLKRQCMSCGAKFYDLGNDPATCPKCGTIYQAASIATSRVAAPAAAARPAREEEEPDVETAGPEMVSLDEVEAAESAAEDPVGDDDADLEEAATPDDTFLEEEEEGDDDVADLIDGDIENDEET